jgi:hypothetical protein
MRYGRILYGAVFLALSAMGAQAQQFLELFGNVNQQGVKICSAVAPNSWRSDLIVPKSWNDTACQGWAHAIGALRGDKACLGPSGVHYDYQYPNQPTVWNTCGW